MYRRSKINFYSVAKEVEKAFFDGVPLRKKSYREKLSILRSYDHPDRVIQRSWKSQSKKIKQWL